MRFSEAVSFLSAQRRLGIKLGLENMTRAMEKLGHPERRVYSILVSGSKGKGSVCVFLESILLAAGYGVGLYTSPHLTGIRERIRVGGSPIPAADFGRSIGTLRAAFRGVDFNPTYFEWLTAMALVYFAARRVPLAILEVGLGGRLDATNIVPAKLSVITEIEKEHTEFLGTRLDAIAREKGGVIRRRAGAVIGVTSPAARRSLAAVAKRMQVRPLWLDREARWEITSHTPHGVRLNLSTARESYSGLRLGIPGRHQAHNAALAVLAAQELRLHGFAIGRRHLRSGLSRARWPGRCDFRPGRPPFFLDGAHTPASARALETTLAELFPLRSRILVFGVLRGKRVARLADILFPGARIVVLVRPPEVRGEEPSEILRRIPPPLRDRCCAVRNVGEALRLARERAGGKDLVVVTGSLFLVGEALRRLPLLSSPQNS